ncbi:iron ABC transporter permease [Actinorhabdospora filicis]|uniref:Iron ABC transporter permease n=1 Tax=Actinorhabdospora filicis TaxID=1785913 RepID=A0A9W6SGZ0_9ACTN|nr:iron ABC transporter permease [Actinorhabdospora filicis]GLZ76098.1 iron ABC transporter permease [Actinorhabdospora filicis]
MIWGLPVALVITASAASLLIGGGDVGPLAALRHLTGIASDEHTALIVGSLRLPRTLAALVVGGGLGLAGALLQAVTRNPLAETGLLGVNAGAALFVVAGISFWRLESGPAFLALAFAGALAASALVLAIAGMRAGVSPLRLVLAGAALSATFRGATAWLLSRDSAGYDRYRFWVLGSLSGITVKDVLRVAPFVAIAMATAVLLVRPMSALSLGDDVAAGLGHRPGRVRIAAAGAVTLLTGAAVALAGPIAFLGLLAPYLARGLAGARMGAVLWLSTVGGGVVLILADIGTRLVARPYEAPVSILLAVVGGPVLVWLVRTNRTLTLGGPA